MSDYGIPAPASHDGIREAISVATVALASHTASGSSAKVISISDGLNAITPKQRKVFSLLSFGFSNKEIAAMLSVAESTIKAHMAAIFQAFGCSNRVQAALIAFSLRQHMPTNDLHRPWRKLSSEEIRNLSSYFDQ